MVIVFIRVTDFYLNRSSPSSDMLQKTKKTLKDVRLIELAKSLSRKYVTKYSMLLGLSTQTSNLQQREEGSTVGKKCGSQL